MKRHLLWTFDRGSFQWDILCLLILAFLFLIPRDTFRDVPEFMKISASDTIRETMDSNGNEVYTVKLQEPCFFDTENTRIKAVGTLEQSLGKPVKRLRTQPIRNWTGRLIGYAIWKER